MLPLGPSCHSLSDEQMHVVCRMLSWLLQYVGVLSHRALLVLWSALLCICHKLMQSVEGFNGAVEITTECPFLSAIWVPLIQAKSDVIALCPLKVVNQGPVKHAPYIDAIPNCPCNLSTNRDKVRQNTSKVMTAGA